MAVHFAASPVLRRLALGAALLASAGSASAQGADLSAEASQTFRPDVRMGGTPGDVGTYAVQVAVTTRFALGPRTFLLSGVSYRGQFLDLAPGATPDLDKAFHTLEVPFGLVHVLDMHWALFGGFTPGLSGDFTGLDRHFRFTTVALATYAFRRDLVLGFGAVLDYSADRILPLPALTVDWQMVDGLWLKVLGPVAKVVARAGDRLEVGAFTQLEGGRWASKIDSDPVSINAFAVDVGALVDVRVTGTTWIDVLGGWSVFRRYEVEGSGRDARYDPANGLVVRAALEVRFPGR
jgi:hypothetical protein